MVLRAIYRPVWPLAILISSLLMGALIVRASAANDSAWNVQVWQPNDASPNAIIAGVAQTEDGYLWVAGATGLSRFDGTKFAQVPVSNLLHADASRIGAIASAHDGSLLIAVYQGPVVRFHDGRSPDIYTGLPKLRPASLLEDSQGAIWLTSQQGGIWRIERGGIQEFSAADGWPEGTGDCWLAEDSKGRIWFSKANQIGIFSGSRFKTLATLSDGPRIARAKEGGIWVTSNFNLYHLSEAAALEFHGSFRPSFASGRALVVFEDRSGSVWIGTTGNGLFHYDGSKFESIPTSFHRIISLMEDREGNIWVGTQSGGLNRIQPRAIVLEGAATGLASDTVMSLCQDAEGVLWAAMQDGSLERRSNGQWMKTELANADDGAMCVAADPNGALWIGTRNGRLLCRGDNGFKAYGSSDGLFSHTISKLLVGRNGDLWLAVQAPDKVQRLHDGKFETFSVPMESDHIRAFAEDSTGAIWVASENGKLWQIMDGKVVDRTSGPTTPETRILSVYVESDDTVWIGTARSGIKRIKNGQETAITAEQGLFDNSIAQLIPDGRGWIWFGSSKGVFKVRQQELDDIADGREKRVRSIHYGDDEGLPPLQATAARSNALRTRDGHIWMIMGTALVTIFPENVRSQSQPPPVVLERITADDTEVAAYGGIVPTSAPVDLARSAGSVSLPSDYHLLQFDFTALTFGAPANVQFQYRIQGFDNHWTDIGAQHQVSFPRLSPGDYQFAVRASGSDGAWGEKAAAVGFTVVPAFWQTWWFKGLGVLLFTAAVVAVARYISFRRLRRRLQVLERQAAVDRERTRIARDLHDELGAGLTNVAMLGDMALRHRGNEQKVGEHAQQITSTCREIMKSLDETVWAVHPRNDTLEHLMSYLGKYAMEFLDTADIRCRVNFLEDAPRIGVAAEVRHNVLLVVKEALNNVVRHAQASEVRMNVAVNGKSTFLSIEDNGRGFGQAPQDALADGLRNMRQRMSDIGGQFEIESAGGKGTHIYLNFPSQSD